MANVNNLVDLVNYINEQVYLLQIRSGELMVRVQALQAATINAGQSAPGNLFVTVDLNGDNPLIRRICGTADIVTRLNRLFGVLMGLTEGAERDAANIARRMRKRMREDDDGDDDDDDETSIVLE